MLRFKVLNTKSDAGVEAKRVQMCGALVLLPLRAEVRGISRKTQTNKLSVQ